MALLRLFIDLLMMLCRDLRPASLSLCVCVFFPLICFTYFALLDPRHIFEGSYRLLRWIRRDRNGET